MIAGVLQAIFEVVLAAILEFVCYFVGRLVVLIVTCGRSKCESFTPAKPRWKFSSGSFYRLRGKQVWLTSDGTTVVGFIAIAISVIVVLWLTFRKA